MPLLALLVAAILAGLAGLHLAWVCGLSWGAAGAIPSSSDGQPAFRPGRLATLVVAIGLLLFAALPLLRFGLLPTDWSPRQLPHLLWVPCGIFLLRSVGDFRYCGVFRKIQDTRFAHLDKLLYTPLSLFLGLAFLFLARA